MHKLGTIAVGAAALATLAGLTPAFAQAAESPAAMQPFEAFASLRELDRKCRFLSFYERVDLRAAIEDARKGPPAPALISKGEAKEVEKAFKAQVAAFDPGALQRSADARVAAMECGSPEANALANNARGELYGQTVFLLRHPLLLDHLKKEAETAPLEWQSANAIFGQIVGRFGDQREAFIKAVDGRVQQSARQFGPKLPKPFFTRLDRLAAAGIIEASAMKKGFAWVYHPQRKPGPQRYDWMRVQGMNAGRASMVLADGLRVNLEQDSGAVTASEAVAMYGIGGDGRMLVMVNSAVEPGQLPDDLRARLLFRATNPSRARWDRRSWRSGVSAVEAERLEGADCPAEACFAFSSDTTFDLAYIVNRPTYTLEFEVYLGTAKAFPPPQESDVGERNYLGGMIPLLRRR